MLVFSDLLTHNQEGPQRGSSYGYSLDGHTWTLSPITPYDCGLNYTDGTTGEARGCGNRPQIFWSDDGETPLFVRQHRQHRHPPPQFDSHRDVSERVVAGPREQIINGAQSAHPGGGKGTWTLFRPLTQPE